MQIAHEATKAIDYYSEKDLEWALIKLKLQNIVCSPGDDIILDWQYTYHAV